MSGAVSVREPGGPIRALEKALAVAWMSATRRFTYLGQLLVQSTFLPLVLFVFSELWKAVERSGFERPSGYSTAQLIWYLTFTEATLFSAANTWNLEVDREVRNGDIAYRLARPLSYPLFCLASSLGERLTRFLTLFAMGGLVSFLVVGPIRLSAAGAVAGLAVSLFSMLIDEQIRLGISLTSFWVENTSGIHLLYRRAAMLLGGMFIPIEAYPEWLAGICRALPFRYLTAEPARIFLSPNAEGLGELLLAQLGFCLFAFLFFNIIYRVGVRRVSAQGG
jgi:ABC-2 type transport system permease protein